MRTATWFFLGLTATATERDWVWTSDQSTLTWNLWNSGEPDNHTNVDCAVMTRGAVVKADKKKWTAKYCDQEKKTIQVVCEKTRKYTIMRQNKQINEGSLIWLINPRIIVFRYNIMFVCTYLCVFGCVCL